MCNMSWTQNNTRERLKSVYSNTHNCKLIENRDAIPKNGSPSSSDTVSSIYFEILYARLIVSFSKSDGVHDRLHKSYPASFIPKAIKLYLMVMLADNVRRLNWEGSLHYHCYV